MSESAHVWQTLESHEAAIAAMKTDLDICTEQLAALLSSLAAVGVVSGERFNAHLHRRRFAVMQNLHGATLRRHGLPDLLEVSEVAQPFAALAGPFALSRARAASRTLGSALRDVTLAAQSRMVRYLYACGGGDVDDPERTVERYNSTTGTWEPLPSMTEERWGAAAAIVGKCVYVCGGGDGQRPLSSAERFDPDRWMWERISPMLAKRYWSAGGTVRGKVIICGGEGPGDEPLSTVESFDPAKFAWQRMPSMEERRACTSGCVMDGCMYVCGGLGTTANLPINSVERYDPVTDQWAYVPPMRVGRSGPSAAATKSKLLVCGGKTWQCQQEADGARLSSVECFDARTETWDFVADMLERRSGAAATSVAGCVYVFGGFYMTPFALSGCEVLDFEVGSWQPLPRLSTRRWCVAGAGCLEER